MSSCLLCSSLLRVPFETESDASRTLLRSRFEGLLLTLDIQVADVNAIYKGNIFHEEDT